MTPTEDAITAQDHLSGDLDVQGRRPDQTDSEHADRTSEPGV